MTATRRSESLQNVPAVIEAFPASTLKAFNVTGINQLPTLASGLVVSPSGGNNIFLRGIGSGSTGYNEAQTAVYIDGIYLANPAMGLYSFNNIDRIEVLKGPQGTLYGRNATAGLISITTHDPGSETRVDASVGYANYDTFTTNFYGSAPLTSNLGFNVAFYRQHQGTGFGRNVFTGNENLKSNETGVQAKLQWRPSSDLKVTTGFIYDYNNRDLGYAYETAPGTLGVDGTPYIGRYRNLSRIDPSAPFHAYIGDIRVEYDFGFATLSSLTAYQASHSTVYFQSGSAAILGQPLLGQGANYSNFYQQNHTFSQEFQLTSHPSGSRLSWVAGTFFYDDHTELRLDSANTCVGTACALIAPGVPFTPTRNDGKPSTLSGSVYGDGTYRFFKATRLTVGLRFTDERKRLAGLVTPLPGYSNSVAALPPAATATTAGTVFYPGQPFPGSPNGIPTQLNFEKLTYRFVLAQDVGRNLHLYVSHNLGFKSGAFNGNLFTNPPARPELLYDTEVGFKSDLLDHRLRINLGYFHYTYKDVQVRSTAPPAPPGNALLQNAAKERIDGIDGDIAIVPVRGLTMTSSFEYLNGKYQDYPGTTISIPKVDANGNPLPGGTILQNQNLTGYRLPLASPFSATFGLVYNVETSVGSFTFSANDHYNQSYPLVADSSIYNGAHNLVDLSVGWTDLGKRYDVQLWVKNLTKEYPLVVGFATTSFAIVPGPPRTFGATLGVHFGH